MFYKIIKDKMIEWYNSDDCKINNIINYMINNNKLRDAQIESIKMYLFFKIYCKNQSLIRLFCDGYFLKNINLDDLPISKNLNEYLTGNTAARQLYEISLIDENYNELKKEIEENYLTLDYKKIFSDFFHNINYSSYIYSLPMGAGKTFLMSAFIYIDLYFAMNEPYNKAFAHNFIILAPSGLKSSIIPSLKKIKDFEVTWIFPEPIATSLKKQLKFEILDEVKTDKKSNKIKNPNVAKIAQYQPYKDMFGVILLTNAEKVILNKVEIVNEQLQLDFDKNDIIGKVANELRETIGKIPNLAIFIDEVHHVASEEIKLNKVVTNWARNNTINEVIGFSGTPYLDTPETFKISSDFIIKNSDITNTVYYYPLTAGIDNFLKKPKIYASSDNNPLNIINEGLTKFFEEYQDVSYNWITSKIAIYCGNIKNLEENIYPFVSEFVTKLGMDANEVILKYHGGNKEYTLPKESELEFASLNTPLSKKRIILLVGIGKEGWDCSSLTGVILSQKGDCPTKMVLQTTCRCLRQVEKDKKETALIYLNKDNEKLLSSQLKKTQHATIEQFQNGTKIGDYIHRYNRMEHLNLPEIEYYKMNIKYAEELKEEAKISRDLKRILSLENIKENVIIKEIDINGNEKINNINEEIYGENINYTEWLLNIVKESFGFISYNDLKEYDSELKKIYKLITIEGNKLNLTYNHKLVNSLIRQAFYDKRKIKVLKEEVPETASILKIQDIPDIECNNKDLQFPNSSVVMKIIDKDDNKEEIDLNSLSPEEFKKVVMNNPSLLIRKDEDEELEVKNRDRTFHYLPYVFNQSSFEKDFFQKILSLNRFTSNDLEVYYNGDHSIASFKIECFKNEDRKLKKVGLYTPDFLMIRRTKDNIIDKILIIETKGKGYSKQQEFIDRRNYVEQEFIKYNNKKYGYNKFDYLYIEDSLSEEKILSLLNDKIYSFFKEEK